MIAKPSELLNASPDTGIESRFGIPGKTKVVVFACCLGFFLINLDATVVNVALPAIDHQLHAGLAGLQWVVAAYTLAFAGLLLSGGSLSDRIGAPRLFGYGLLTFVIASTACGLAPDIVVLIIARVLQGAAAAAVLPASLALLRQSIADPAGRARAIAIWAAGGGAAVAAGPVVGGFLTELLDWRAVFFVNVPFGLLALIALSQASRSAPQQSPVDIFGQLLAIIAMTGFTFATIEIARTGPLSPMVLIPLAVFVVGVLWFLRVESKVKTPMVDLRELRSRVFVSCLTTGFALNFAYYGIMFVFSLLFQQERDWSPIEIGLSFLPLTAFVLASNLAAGKLTAQFGPRLPMTCSLLLEALGFVGVLVVGPHGPTWLLLLTMVPIGIGGGVASPPMMTALMDAVPAERAGAVAGLLSSCRQAGGTIGVAAFGVLISATGFGMATGLRVAAASAAVLLAFTAILCFRFIRAGSAVAD